MKCALERRISAKPSPSLPSSPMPGAPPRCRPARPRLASRCRAWTLRCSFVYAFGELVLIEVKDQCGGLPPGSAEIMFKPFTQRSDDKSGLGLGLSIARQSIEADAGTLSVRDMPGTGCVFTISLPRRMA